MFQTLKRARACERLKKAFSRSPRDSVVTHRFSWTIIIISPTLVTTQSGPPPRRNILTTTTLTAVSPPPSKRRTPPRRTTTFSAALPGSELRPYPLASKTTARSSPVSTAPHAPPSPRFQSSISPSIKASPLTSGERASTTAKSSEASTISISLPRTRSSLFSSGGVPRWLTEIPPTMLGHLKKKK